MTKDEIEKSGYILDDDGFYYKRDAKKIAVICSCGCNAFTLRYKEYEIVAKCLNCGREGSVYSG